MRFAAALMVAATMAIAACSPLKTFDAVIAKDGGSRKIASDVPYGEGDRRKLDVYVPTGVQPSAEPRPVVMFFYGGSWNSGTRKGYDFVGRALAARGFVTIIPDYRLVPDVRFPAFVEDGAAAVRWAQANAGEFGGDPDGIVLAGHSAGAYIAAMLAVDDRWLRGDRDGVRGVVGLAGPYDFAPFDGPVTRDAFGNWPDPAQTQPINFADAGDPPALLLTGADDDTVDPANSETLARKLREAGVAAQVKRYPDVGHVGIVTSIAKPFRGKATTLDDMGAFVDRVTQ